MNNHIIIDFETLGTEENSVVLSFALTLFDPSQGITDFQHYLKNTYYWKFDTQSQIESGRVVNNSTLDWWGKQDSKVQQEQLEPSFEDIKLSQFVKELYEFCKEHEVNQKSIGWARGKEFDFGILKNILKTEKHVLDKDQCPINENTFPIPFWNRRDIRDYIAGLMVSPSITKVPLPKGSLDGFKHHDPIHDCARAAMHIVYGQKYAMGELDIPGKYDPNSNK